MKKTLAALLASAFALTLYAADASACPGHDKATVSQKDKKKNEETAKEQEKKKENKEQAAPKAPEKKKVS
jgi:hypothetical protein